MDHRLIEVCVRGQVGRKWKSVHINGLVLSSGKIMMVASQSGRPVEFLKQMPVFVCTKCLGQGYNLPRMAMARAVSLMEPSDSTGSFSRMVSRSSV